MVMGTRYCVCATGPSSLFRRKRLISSAALFPMRSASPAMPANWRGAASFCPKVLDVLRIPHIQRDAVHYEPLPGQTLRQLDRNDPECGDTVRRNWAS